MRLLAPFVAFVLCGCSQLGGVHQACKVLDPELAQGVYQGSCKDGLADGYGEVTGPASYKGDFLAGKKHGKGTKIMTNGDRYTGGFRDDYRDGQGVYVWSGKSPWTGNRYEGGYQHDQRSGWGVLEWNDGDRYEGEWENDMRLGRSVMEQRRVQTDQAIERSLKPGVTVCAEEKWDKVNYKRIRGTVEGVAGDMVLVKIIEVEGGRANYYQTDLAAGSIFNDDADHWRLCGQN